MTATKDIQLERPITGQKVLAWSIGNHEWVIVYFLDSVFMEMRHGIQTMILARYWHELPKSPEPDVVPLITHN